MASMRDLDGIDVMVVRLKDESLGVVVNTPGTRVGLADYALAQDLDDDDSRLAHDADGEPVAVETFSQAGKSVQPLECTTRRACVPVRSVRSFAARLRVLASEMGITGETRTHEDVRSLLRELANQADRLIPQKKK